jgi:hypothetical protein
MQEVFSEKVRKRLFSNKKKRFVTDGEGNFLWGLGGMGIMSADLCGFRE